VLNGERKGITVERARIGAFAVRRD
jgi:hypothetical protein